MAAKPFQYNSSPKGKEPGNRNLVFYFLIASAAPALAFTGLCGDFFRHPVLTCSVFQNIIGK
jgi:hypothetical protein